MLELPKRAKGNGAAAIHNPTRQSKKMSATDAFEVPCVATAAVGLIFILLNELDRSIRAGAPGWSGRVADTR